MAYHVHSAVTHYLFDTLPLIRLVTVNLTVLTSRFRVQWTDFSPMHSVFQCFPAFAAQLNIHIVSFLGVPVFCAAVYLDKLSQDIDVLLDLGSHTKALLSQYLNLYQSPSQ